MERSMTENNADQPETATEAGRPEEPSAETQPGARRPAPPGGSPSPDSGQGETAQSPAPEQPAKPKPPPLRPAPPAQPGAARPPALKPAPVKPAAPRPASPPGAVPHAPAATPAPAMSPATAAAPARPGAAAAPAAPKPAAKPAEPAPTPEEIRALRQTIVSTLEEKKRSGETVTIEVEHKEIKFNGRVLRIDPDEGFVVLENIDGRRRGLWFILGGHLTTHDGKQIKFPVDGVPR